MHDECSAVFQEQIFCKTRQGPQGILAVFSRHLTLYREKSALQNRQGFDSRLLKEENFIMEILLNHWHCILPAAAVLAALLLMNRKETPPEKREKKEQE